MQRYLVWLVWKGTGKTHYYCSVAESPRDAIALVVNGRDSAIDAGEAIEWPVSLGGPTPRDMSTPRSFRLRHEPTIEAALLSLGETTQSAPRATVANDNAAGRPGSTIAPWRRAKPLSSSRRGP